MAKIRFAARISQAVFTSIILFALLYIIFTGIIAAVNGMVIAQGGTAVFPSPWLELLMGFVGFAIPISIEIGRYNDAEVAA